MIDAALEFIRKELRDHLGVSDAEVVVGPARTLTEENNAEGAYITLVNVEEESALRNGPHTERRLGQPVYREPAVHLNLSLLFAFEFTTYAASLLHLSNTVELFQKKRFYDGTNETPGNPFPAELARLKFELVNMSFEQLNHLWGVLGGAYFPSVVYKVRLVKIHADEVLEAPEITTVELESSLS